MATLHLADEGSVGVTEQARQRCVASGFLGGGQEPLDPEFLRVVRHVSKIAIAKIARANDLFACTLACAIEWGMPIPTLTPEDARELAERSETTPAYLYQVLTGRRKANPALARRINAADPRILLSDLRPTDWQVIWPELAQPTPQTQEATHG